MVKGIVIWTFLLTASSFLYLQPIQTTKGGISIGPRLEQIPNWDLRRVAPVKPIPNWDPRTKALAELISKMGSETLANCAGLRRDVVGRVAR